MDRQYIQFLLAHADLLQHILRFNTELSSSLESSEPTLPYALTALEKDILLQLQQKHKKLALFQQESCPFFLFEHTEDRLCLLSPSEVAILCLYVGACRSSTALSHIVLKKDKEKLLSCCGEAVYTFALTLGKLMIHSGDYKVDLSLSADEIKSDLVSKGAQSCLALLPLLSHPLLQQSLQKKLQALVSVTFILPNDPPERLFKLCRTILIQELQWTRFLN